MATCDISQSAKYCVHLWPRAFCKSTWHIGKHPTSHIPNIPHPEHPTSQTSYISNIPHTIHPISRISHIPSIPYPQHPKFPTSHIPSISHLHHPTCSMCLFPSIPHSQHPTSRQTDHLAWLNSHRIQYLRWYF